ncbi:hypothetical protein ABT173_13125 [Streptomyces sp. NPDC001795]|uniref:hypothetical protein n=1 Tax=unclassified Streptomyces TaxID=2593676 RepID=UPI00332B0F72
MRTTRALAAGVLAAAAIGFAAPTSMAMAWNEPGGLAATPRRSGAGHSAGATPADMAIGGGLVATAVIGGGAYWLFSRSEDET